jgi:uridine kinase
MSDHLLQVSTVIAISGPSGAGKTALTKKVAALLGDAVTLHFDDYQSVAVYPKFPDGIRQWIEEGCDLDAWQIPQLIDDLAKLRSGIAILRPTDQGEIAPARFIVLEEPSGRTRAGLRNLVDFVVLVDLPLEIALARKVAQDLQWCLTKRQYGDVTDVVQGMSNYYAHYPLARAYYRTCIEHVRSDCHLIVDGMQPIDTLAQQIVELVQGITDR